jgi:hypothetical protein
MAALATSRSINEDPARQRHGIMALSLDYVETAVNVRASIHRLDNGASSLRALWTSSPSEKPG